MGTEMTARVFSDITCPVCGNKKTTNYSDDVIDFEYHVEGYFPLVQCSGCGLIRQKFIPDYARLRHFYPEDYLVYGETSRSRLGLFLAVLKKQLYKQRARRYVRLIGKSGRILDVGCANCSLLMSLKPFGNYELYGIDIKDLGVDYESLGVKFHEGPLEEIDFPAGFFDLVVLDNLIEHVPDPVFFLKKVCQILKPGGWVMGTTPNIRSIDALIFGRYWGGYHIPRHLYFFNRDALERFLRKCGFSNISFPINANPGDWCVSIQNFLRRNKSRMKKYNRGWYFPLVGCLLMPLSLLFSICGWHSIMDFEAQKRKGAKMNGSRDSQKYLTSNPLKRKLINRFLKKMYFYIRQLQPRTILDIGCGEGFVDMFLLQKDPQYQIKGIDISKKNIEIAKKRVPRLSIQQGNAYNLPFRANTFDLTICTEVLEHLDNPQKAISEALRVSKKYCLFSVPNEPLFSILSLFSGAYIKHLGRHPDHINFWTKKPFRNLIQRYFTKPVIVKTSSVWTFVIGEK